MVFNVFFSSVSSASLDDSGNSGRTSGNVYAQNLDLHLQTTDADDVPPRSASPNSNEFFQPEPALLDIAAGAGSHSEPLMSPQETLAPDNSFVYRYVKIEIILFSKILLLW